MGDALQSTFLLSNLARKAPSCGSRMMGGGREGGWVGGEEPEEQEQEGEGEGEEESQGQKREMLGRRGETHEMRDGGHGWGGGRAGWRRGEGVVLRGRGEGGSLGGVEPLGKRALLQE